MEDNVTLYIPSWRLKLVAGIIIVASVWRLAVAAENVGLQLKHINNALRAEFDATRTPAVEKRRLGEYQHIEVEEEADDD